MTERMRFSAPPLAERRPAARPAVRRTVGNNWFAVCALLLLVATDYKFRVRDVSSSVSGHADAAIYLEVLAYGGVLGYLLITRGRAPRIGRIPAPMFALTTYVVVMATSILETPYRSLAGVRLTEMVILLVLVATVVADGERDHLHRFAHGFMVLVALSVIFGKVHPMPRFRLQGDRFTWLRIHPVVAGVYVGLATIIALTYLIESRSSRSVRPGPRWSPWRYGALLAICGGGLLGTKTRGAVVGALVGAAVIVVLRRRGRDRLQLLGFGALVIIAVGLASLGAITSYFVRGETVASLSTLNDRTNLWSLAWDSIKQKPMYGWGLEASRDIFLDSTGLGGGHNAVINVAVDLGAVGMLAWLAVLVVGVATVWRCRARVLGIPTDRTLLLAIVAFLLSDGMFYEGVGATSNIASITLFIVIGWSVLLGRANRVAVGSSGPESRKGI